MSPILIVVVEIRRESFLIEKYCYDSDLSNCESDGGLYEWPEMMQYSTTASTQGVCPTGWHLPTDYEWMMMEMSLRLPHSEAGATNPRVSRKYSSETNLIAICPQGNILHTISWVFNTGFA